MEAFQRRLVRQTASIDAVSVPFSKVLSSSVLSVLPFFLLLMCIVSSRSMWSDLLILIQESPTLRFVFLNILIGCIIVISQKRKCSSQVETEHEAEIEDRCVPPLITRNLDRRNGAEAEIGVVERTLMVPGSGTNSSKEEEDSYLMAKETKNCKDGRGKVNAQHIIEDQSSGIAEIEVSAREITKRNLTESNSGDSIYLATMRLRRGNDSIHISPNVSTVRRDADNKQLVMENLSADRIKRVAGNRSTKRRVQPSLIADGSKLASLKERTNRCNGDYIGSAEPGKDNCRSGDAKHRAAMKKAKHGLRAGEVDTKGANTTDKNEFQACPSMEEVWVHIMSNRHERECESTINQETQRTVQKENRAPCINEGAEGENHQEAAASSPGED